MNDKSKNKPGNIPAKKPAPELEPKKSELAQRESEEKALFQRTQSQKEHASILQAARTVLEGGSFNKTACDIYNICKDLIGYTHGYVALLSDDEKINEMLFLDSGNKTCNVDPHAAHAYPWIQSYSLQPKKNCL